ncbi:hypothetical protein HK102_011575, partial [Quaeritorhiza haematococci]
MGARYSGDWDSRCTHLICPFKNTPKYNQVKSSGHGAIVRPDWIEECHRRKKRLPEKHFLLDRPISTSDSDASVSETEPEDDGDEG